MPFLITKASNMHRLLIFLAISLASSVPVEEDTHPDGNLLDSTVQETVVYEESTEELISDSTDSTILAAIDDVIQQLNSTGRSEQKKPQSKIQKELVVLPKEVVISSGSIQTKETGQRQSKRIRFDDDGVQIIDGVYKPDDPNDKKIYRNARVINNQLVENSTVSKAESGGRRGRFFSDETAEQPKLDTIAKEVPHPSGKIRYPDFYYRSYYSDEQGAEATEAATTTKNPFGYDTSLHDSKRFRYIPFRDSETAGTENSRHGGIEYQQYQKQERELAVSHDNQQYIVKQQVYHNGDGSTFVVPLPYPVENAYQYDQSSVQYQPYALYREKSKVEVVKEKVDEVMAKVHDFARPVVDPLKEAKEKISYNLGIPEKMSHFQSRLAKASHDPKTVAIAGGAAAVLGTIGAGLLFSSAAAGRSAKKLKESRKTDSAHNVTRRDVSDKYDIEPEQIELDHILRKLDSSQKQLLEQMQKTGFLQSLEGPCGQAVMCQTLAADTSDYKLELIRRRAALFGQLLSQDDERKLQDTLGEVIKNVKTGNCSGFSCDTDDLAEFLKTQSEIPR